MNAVMEEQRLNEEDMARSKSAKEAMRLAKAQTSASSMMTGPSSSQVDVLTRSNTGASTGAAACVSTSPTPSSDNTNAATSGASRS